MSVSQGLKEIHFRISLKASEKGFSKPLKALLGPLKPLETSRDLLKRPETTLKPYLTP